MAARFLSLASALPAHRLGPEELLEHLARYWPQLARLDLGEEIGTRYLVEPPATLLQPRSLDATMKLYSRHATDLAEAACREALERAGVEARQVDVVMSVSCTGYMVPSLDAHLVGRLGLRSDVARLPITELGCSGGAAAVAFAHRHLVGHPRDRVLVVAVELSSLSFRPGDRSRDNLVASMIFGDGAAAAVLGGPGEEVPLRVQSVASHLVPGTAHMLGFELGDGGFRVVLERTLPDVVGAHLGGLVDEFRRAAHVERLDFVAAHGGGPRILDAVEAALDLPPTATAAARDVFRRVGNLSSASVLLTLEELASSLGPEPAEGLGIGLGPGLSVELMHLSWAPSPVQSSPGMKRAFPANLAR